MRRIPGVILAGGLSRRMGGGDKCLLHLGGVSLLQHVINRITPQVGKLAINANGSAERFSQYKLPVIKDVFPGFAGPLAGVLTAMDWAAGLEAEYVATVAADTPFFPANLVSRFEVEMSDDQPIILAATLDAKRGEIRHPTFGLWSVELRSDLRMALEAGTRKVVDWTEQQRGASTIFPSEVEHPFFNVNTEQDMVVARSILAANT